MGNQTNALTGMSKRAPRPREELAGEKLRDAPAERGPRAPDRTAFGPVGSGGVPPLPGVRRIVPAECGDIPPNLGGTADVQSALSDAWGGFFHSSLLSGRRNRPKKEIRGFNLLAR